MPGTGHTAFLSGKCGLLSELIPAGCTISHTHTQICRHRHVHTHSHRQNTPQTPREAHSCAHTQVSRHTHTYVDMRHAHTDTYMHRQSGTHVHPAEAAAGTGGELRATREPTRPQTTEGTQVRSPAPRPGWFTRTEQGTNWVRVEGHSAALWPTHWNTWDSPR